MDSEPITKRPIPETPKEALKAHHVSNILDEVLTTPETEPPPHRFRSTMIMDLLLGLGLLIAMAGFSTGLVRMYVSHSAEQNIVQGNYRAAISLLSGSSFPGFFTNPGSDSKELLNQALYLDAIEKLDAYSEDQTAVEELEQIEAGSRFFELAQEVLKDHFKPSSITLQGGTQKTREISPQEAAKASKPDILKRYVNTP